MFLQSKLIVQREWQLQYPQMWSSSPESHHSSFWGWQCESINPIPHCTPADFLIPTHKLLGQISNPSCKASLCVKCHNKFQLAHIALSLPNKRPTLSAKVNKQQTLVTELFFSASHKSLPGRTWEPAMVPDRAVFLTWRSGAGWPRNSLVFMSFIEVLSLFCTLSIVGLL